MDNYRKRQTVYPDGTIRRVRQGEGRRQPPPPTDKTKYNYAQRINYDGYYNGGGYNPLKTGDDSSFNVYAAMLLISGVACILAGVAGRRRKNEE